MNDSFADELTKQAIARACVALGYKKGQQGAIDALADVVKTYVTTLGTVAQQQAESSGRVHAGIHDVLPTLEYLRPKNTSWKELSKFAFDDLKNPNNVNTSKWCQPFPIEVPEFPLSIDLASNKNTESIGECRTDSFVPKHLPPYPPAHTYKTKKMAKKRNISDSLGDSVDESANKSARAMKKAASISAAQQSLTVIEDSADLTKS